MIRLIKSAFCNHYYVKIGEYHQPGVFEWQSTPFTHEYIICKKCGHYREVDQHKWNIIKSRQIMLKGDEHK